MKKKPKRNELMSKIKEQLGVLKNVPVVRESDSPSIVLTGHDFIDSVIGGIPFGKILHLYGNPGSCKSLMAYDMVARVQKAVPDKVAVIIDTEGSVDKKWFDWIKSRGVDTREEKLIVVDTNIAEDVFESAIRLASTGEVSIIVIDSIGNLITKSEATLVEESKLIYGTKSVAEVARIVTRGMKDISMYIHRNNTMAIIINQLRDVISPFFPVQSQTTPGGRALKHISHLAMKFSRVGDIKYKGRIIGMTVKVRIDKSKLSVSGLSSDARNHLKFFFESHEGDDVETTAQIEEDWVEGE